MTSAPHRLRAAATDEVGRGAEPMSVHRPGLQSCAGDRLLAHLTDPVATLLQSNSGGLAAEEMLLRPLNERRQP